jgi:hypothetical protein
LAMFSPTLAARLLLTAFRRLRHIRMAVSDTVSSSFPSVLEIYFFFSFCIANTTMTVTRQRTIPFLSITYNLLCICCRVHTFAEHPQPYLILALDQQFRLQHHLKQQ